MGLVKKIISYSLILLASFSFRLLAAQAAQLNCDTANFSTYFVTLLPNLGVVDKSTADALQACTEFVECLPTAAAIINASHFTDLIQDYNNTDLSLAKICPECLLLNALIVTMIIYLKQSQTAEADEFFPYPYNDLVEKNGGAVQPYFIAFPLANLTPFLTNISHSPATVPTIEQCASLFSFGKYYNNPFKNTKQELWPYTSSFICENTIYLGNLYNTLNVIAQAKLTAMHKICYLPAIVTKYQSQSKTLQDCIADVTPYLINGVTLPPPFPATVPTGFPPGLSIKFQNLMADLTALFKNYNTAIDNLINCCTTADELCNKSYGADYSTAVLGGTDVNAQQARALLTELLDYKTFTYTNVSRPAPNPNLDPSMFGIITGGGPGLAPKNLPCGVAEWPCMSSLQPYSCDQCCYGNVGDGKNVPGPAILQPATACLYNNGVLWSQLALLLSGAFPLADGQKFNSVGGTVFKSATDIITTACGTPGDQNSICYLDFFKIINPINSIFLQFIQDIQAGNLSDVQKDILQGADVNIVVSQNNFMTPLMYAAKSAEPDNLQIVQYLLSIPNINLFAIDNNQHTALWYAQNSTNPQKATIISAIATAQLLTHTINNNPLTDIQADIAAGADINIVDRNNLTPLLHAALIYDANNPDSVALIKYLLSLNPKKPADSNLNINFQDSNGWTALMHAVFAMNLPLVTYLLPDPTKPMPTKDTPGYINWALTGTYKTEQKTTYQLAKIATGGYNSAIIQALIKAGSPTA